MTEKEMTFLEHLEELRSKIIISLVTIVVFAVASYFFVPQIIDFLTRPLDNSLIYISPTEAFFTQLKVALFSGIFIGLPVIFYEFFSFVFPALGETTRKYLLFVVILSYLFFVGGAAFGLLVVIPFGVRFFLSFASTNLEAMFSLGNYISFIITILIPFGLVFELPVLTTILVKMRIISSKFLRSKRKIVLVLIFIFAALLTPPDIVSQAMMALPLIVLYEGSIIWARIIE